MVNAMCGDVKERWVRRCLRRKILLVLWGLDSDKVVALLVGDGGGDP